MIFENFVIFLFLIFETSFYLVRGQTNNEEKSDCTKFYNFVHGNTLDYSNSCCLGTDNKYEISCDSDGFIQSIIM